MITAGGTLVVASRRRLCIARLAFAAAIRPAPTLWAALHVVGLYGVLARAALLGDVGDRGLLAFGRLLDGLCRCGRRCTALATTALALASRLAFILAAGAARRATTTARSLVFFRTCDDRGKVAVVPFDLLAGQLLDRVEIFRVGRG